MEMQNKSQRGIGAILSYVTIIVNTFVQLLYTPFLTRMLGQSEYGLYSLVSSVIGYLTILDLGFGNAIIVFTVKYRAQGKYEEVEKMHGMFSVIYFIIALFASAAGIFLSFFANSFFKNSMTTEELHKARIMLLILTFNVGITFIFSIYPSIIAAYEQFVFQKMMSIISTILRPLIMIPLLFLGYKSITMCVVLTIVNIFVLYSNYQFCKIKLKINLKFRGFDKSLFFILVNYSFFIFLTIVVDKVNWSVDHFILGVLCGTIEISVYSIASQLTQLFLNLSTAINGVFLPKISQMVARNEGSEVLTAEMIKIGRLQFLIINLIATGMILVGKPFIIWWAGFEYEKSYYIALILILPACLPLIQSLGLIIMQAMNKHKFRAIMITVMSALNIIISIYLAQRFQAVGAAIGTAIAQIIGNVIIMNLYYKNAIKLDIKQFWMVMLKMFLQLLPPAILVLAVMSLTKLHGIFSVFAYGLLYVVCYCFSAYKFAMNAYEKSIVKNIFGNLRN